MDVPVNRQVRRILIVEDEEKIAGVLISLLESKGFEALWASDGYQALKEFDKEVYHLVLLDLMLPGISGEEVCKTLRKTSDIPIIMITAKAAEQDQLQGLGLGADDYITKPFSLRTLSARIEAVLRRTAPPIISQGDLISYNNGDLMIDASARKIYRKGEMIKLTPNEAKLLFLLVNNSNRVYSRDELIDIAFGQEFEGFDRTVDSHIKNLRAKLEEDPKNPAYIKTIYGVGYRFGGEADAKH